MRFAALRDASYCSYFFHSLPNAIFSMIIIGFFVLYSTSKGMNSNRGTIISKLNIPHDRFRSCSIECPFVVTGNRNDSVPDINFISFRGYGRTGNYIKSLRNAINLAFECKLSIQMPNKDDKGDAFPLNNAYSFLNFSRRPGSVDPRCHTMALPLSGDAKMFWYFNLSKIGQSRWSLEHERQKVSCLRKFLGLCDSKFCKSHSNFSVGNSENSVFIHLREGDIFKDNFNSDVHHGYGQPPLSYYLHALAFSQWDKVIVVTQPGNPGPIRKAMIVLNNTQTFSLYGRIYTQMGSWREDLNTLLCASNLIMSKTTLDELFVIGFARNIFSHRCLKNVFKDKNVYKIGISNYTPFINHDNSPQEWLEMLFHSSDAPEYCRY